MRTLLVAAGVWAASAGTAVAQQGAILGNWRGTSTCVKDAANSACNDEQVIYHFTAMSGKPDSVALAAEKIVAGKPEPMFDLTLGRDAGEKAWSTEWSNARYHILWSFQASGDTLTGTLYMLPDRRVARNVRATRTP